METREFNVAGDFLPALINDDTSGICDYEVGLIDAFERQLGNFSHYSVEPDCEYWFGLCDICKLHSNVAELTVVYL